jgi:hypothetical protein
MSPGSRRQVSTKHIVRGNHAHNALGALSDIVALSTMLKSTRAWTNEFRI